MLKPRVIFVLSFLIVLMPMLGFPRGWETALIIFFALCNMFVVIVPVPFVRKVLGLGEVMSGERQTTLPFSFVQKEGTKKREELVEKDSDEE